MVCEIEKVQTNPKEMKYLINSYRVLHTDQALYWKCNLPWINHVHINVKWNVWFPYETNKCSIISLCKQWLVFILLYGPMTIEFHIKYYWICVECKQFIEINWFETTDYVYGIWDCEKIYIYNSGYIIDSMKSTKLNSTGVICSNHFPIFIKHW